VVTAAILGLGWLSATIHIGALPSAFDIVQAVWNSIAASYNLPGSLGEKLNAAGAGGDPWTIPLPGGYPGGTAGKIVGEFVDAKLSEVKAKTDNLPVDPAAQSLVQAVKAKTDNLPLTPADEALLETILTAMEGPGWTDESLKKIKDAVDAILPGGGGSGELPL
jgi:hypothetical protein